MEAGEQAEEEVEEQAEEEVKVIRFEVHPCSWMRLCTLDIELNDPYFWFYPDLNHERVFVHARNRQILEDKNILILREFSGSDSGFDSGSDRD